MMCLMSICSKENLSRIDYVKIFNMNRRVVLVLFVLISAVSNLAFAQCDSKVTAKTKTLSETRGEITVEITSSGNFVCRLNAISGSGIEAIESENGNGSKSIKFSNVDITKIYQVDVEFTTEEKQLCKRLQKNDLIFEPK